jgi:hypothetical protein
VLRSSRGYTFALVVADEAAFWRSESSVEPDVEVLQAIRPGLATLPGARLIVISSPYARRGVLWTAFRVHYGQEGAPVLVWRAPTQTMNASLPARVVEAAYQADPASAAAEYGAEFRTDIEAFITRELIDACNVPGRHGLPPVRRTTYTAFVDPSGGAQDAFSLAIAHQETRGGREVSILDHLSARRPPFSPEQVVKEFSATLAAYDVQRVIGDRYGGEWPREQFRKHGVAYEASERTKSDLYRELLPLLTSGRVELLDHPKLATELLGLERRTARGGRDSIDHSPGGHDDLANAAAGALVLAGAAPTATMLFLDDPGGEKLERAPSLYVNQIKEARPDWFYRPEPALVCGTCTAFAEGRCTLRGLLVEASMLKCDVYDPVPARGL